MEKYWRRSKFQVRPATRAACPIGPRALGRELEARSCAGGAVLAGEPLASGSRLVAVNLTGFDLKNVAPL